MDKRLKQRLIGAAVLIALAVIFLPMLLTGHGSHPVSMKIKLPPEPDYHFSNSIQKPLAPLTTQPSATTLTAIPNMTTETPVAQAPPPGVVSPTGVIAAPKQPSSPSLPPVKAKPLKGKVKSPAKAPPPLSETKPASHPVGSGWVIQVASLVDPQGADQLRDRLRKAGYGAYVDRITIHGKTYYRVRVGPRFSRSKAEKVLADLQHKVKLKGMLVPYP